MQRYIGKDIDKETNVHLLAMKCSCGETLIYDTYEEPEWTKKV